MAEVDTRLWAVQIEAAVMQKMQETAREGAHDARQARVAVVQEHLDQMLQEALDG